MNNIALIIGISGQDGSYLTELLLSKGYYVWGLVRKSYNAKIKNLNHLLNSSYLKIVYGDVRDGANLIHLLSNIKKEHPNLSRLEIYNLAALSHVKVSFELPEYCADVTGMGTLRVLEAIRLSGFSDKIRFYQASTSEMFGKVVETPQTEKTPFYPRSPYAISKLFAYWTTKNYREAYGLFACNGILFNHESPRRDELFVTRKITKGLSDIIHNRKDKLFLGNLAAYRDWGHSKDYVYGMWLMLQQDTPDDFLLATNNTHTIKEFVEKSFSIKGFNIKWKGEGINEIGYDEKTGRELIFVSPEFFRPTEVDFLIGDYTKAKDILGWQPVYTFEKLVNEMVEHDCRK